MNSKNKERAATVTALAAQYDNGDTRDNLVDLLTNVRHACDAHGIDFISMDRIAWHHYSEERDEPDQATELSLTPEETKLAYLCLERVIDPTGIQIDTYESLKTKIGRKMVTDMKQAAGMDPEYNQSLIDKAVEEEERGEWKDKCPNCGRLVDDNDVRLEPNGEDCNFCAPEPPATQTLREAIKEREAEERRFEHDCPDNCPPLDEDPAGDPSLGDPDRCPNCGRTVDGDNIVIRSDGQGCDQCHRPIEQTPNNRPIFREHSKDTALGNLWLTLEKIQTDIHNTVIPLCQFLDHDQLGDLAAVMECTATEIANHFTTFKLQAIRRTGK